MITSARRLLGSTNCSCIGFTVVRYCVTTLSRERPRSFYIAQGPAENPHVRIGIDKDFDVHQIAEIILNEEENALEHDNRGRMDQNRFIRAVMHGIIVNRHLDGFSGFQLENVLA